MAAATIEGYAWPQSVTAGDALDIYVSTDGGANFWWQAQFTGNSGGYTTDTVDLSWAAGQTVHLHLPADAFMVLA